jgi:hypothetical protein
MCVRTWETVVEVPCGNVSLDKAARYQPMYVWTILSIVGRLVREHGLAMTPKWGTKPGERGPWCASTAI